uniref:U2-Liphistoxin-Lth1a_1 n=1 Tax=Liphistius thaleban TaxID=1905330 RepID=A0A4Q8K4V9_9ARAC
MFGPAAVAVFYSLFLFFAFMMDVDQRVTARSSGDGDAGVTGFAIDHIAARLQIHTEFIQFDHEAPQICRFQFITQFIMFRSKEDAARSKPHFWTTVSYNDFVGEWLVIHVLIANFDSSKPCEVNSICQIQKVIHDSCGDHVVLKCFHVYVFNMNSCEGTLILGVGCDFLLVFLYHIIDEPVPSVEYGIAK